MRGIVVEINKEHAAILSDNGIVSKVKNRNYSLGQIIYINEKNNKKPGFVKGAAGFAAAIAAFTIGGVAYFTPTDYISLDVNPSIEYSVNMFDRVLDVKALNDDGKEILKSLYLNNHTIEEAVDLTLGELIDSGYLTNDEDGGVVVTTYNENSMEEADKLASDLKEEIQEFVDKHKEITAAVDAEAVDKEKIIKAKELGVSPGKLHLVEKLIASDSGLQKFKDLDSSDLSKLSDSDINELKTMLNMSVKTINKTIKENRSQTKATDKDQIEENKGKEQKDKNKSKDNNKSDTIENNDYKNSDIKTRGKGRGLDLIKVYKDYLSYNEDSNGYTSIKNSHTYNNDQNKPKGQSENGRNNN